MVALLFEELKIVAFHFAAGTSVREAIAAMDKAGYRLPTRAERRAFYEQNPNERRNAMVNILGVHK